MNSRRFCFAAFTASAAPWLQLPPGTPRQHISLSCPFSSVSCGKVATESSGSPQEPPRAPALLHPALVAFGMLVAAPHAPHCSPAAPLSPSQQSPWVRRGDTFQITAPSSQECPCLGACQDKADLGMGPSQGQEFPVFLYFHIKPAQRGGDPSWRLLLGTPVGVQLGTGVPPSIRRDFGGRACMDTAGMESGTGKPGFGLAAGECWGLHASPSPFHARFPRRHLLHGVPTAALTHHCGCDTEPHPGTAPSPPQQRFTEP